MGTKTALKIESFHNLQNIVTTVNQFQIYEYSNDGEIIRYFDMDPLAGCWGITVNYRGMSTLRKFHQLKSFLILAVLHQIV